MCINTKLDTMITIDGTQIECSAFARLPSAWKSNSYSKETQLYNSEVKATLMYGSENWGICESERKSLNTLHTGSLRRILGIH
ncbi:RNA-directed DNA polymerase from mobile element jockey [Brachionus plicatilis]|uniref:RNA-directed DNA polymerase from mobile element jockey n=1 Tax=Brachionus plicatilis TaxID=10195 RepID=A0A3M7QW81_BRAPC|nr:RNA-directed DNA polymerase from mobile element jockey [Brachionus plicatilis]